MRVLLDTHCWLWALESPENLNPGAHDLIESARDPLYLSAASAVKIGLVPKLPLPRIVSAGNVAGEGAKIVALSITERAAAAAILDEVAYVELSGRTDFNDLFIDQLSFPV